MSVAHRWSSGAPDHVACIDCSGAQHTIILRNGRIVLADHPRATRERVLVALGGVRPTCLTVLEAFVRARNDPTLWWYLLDPNGERELTALRMFQSPRLQQAIRSSARQLPQPFDGERLIEAQKLATSLVELPQAMRSQLGVSVAVGWLRRWDSLPSPVEEGYDARTQLGRMTAVLAEMAIRGDGRRDVAVDVAFTAPGQSPSLRVDESIATMTVRLEPGWLVDVWWRGLSKIDGSFVLSASGRGRHDQVRVRVVDLDLNHAHARIALATYDEGRWSLT